MKFHITNIKIEWHTLQVYLYDINSAQRPVLLENYIVQYNRSKSEGESRPPEVSTTVELPPLPEEIKRIKDSVIILSFFEVKFFYPSLT